jgi:hypothetical protein
VADPIVAVVATVRDPGLSFRTWIAYHLNEVDRLYIVLDKPGTGDEQLIPDDPRVTVLAGAQESSLSGQSGVMQRQFANVARAVELCRATAFRGCFTSTPMSSHGLRGRASDRISKESNPT